MSLLRDISNAAAESAVDIATLIRKCKILANRLKSDDLARWVDAELNGYASDRPLPDYRRLQVKTYGQFFSVAWHVPQSAIPLSVAPKESRHLLYEFEFRDGIAKAMQFATKPVSIDRVDWIPLIQGKVYPDLNCIRVWQEIGSSEFIQMISAVKTRVLDFALQIEAENPAAGEASPDIEPIPKEKLQPLIQNVFNGPIGALAQASHGFHQTTNVVIRVGDLKSLRANLRAHGVAEGELDQLEQAITGDQESHTELNQPGQRVTHLLGQWAMKGGAKAVEIGKEVAVSVITEALKSYFKLPGA